MKPSSLIASTNDIPAQPPIVAAPVTIHKLPDEPPSTPKPVPIAKRPIRPVLDHQMAFDSSDQRINEENQTLYRYQMGEYIMNLAQFHYFYGLLPGELPVYFPLDYPHLQHYPDFQPALPSTKDLENNPKLRLEHEQAKAACDAWNNADEAIVNKIHAHKLADQPPQMYPTRTYSSPLAPPPDINDTDDPLVMPFQ